MSNDPASDKVELRVLIAMLRRNAEEAFKAHEKYLVAFKEGNEVERDKYAEAYRMRQDAADGAQQALYAKLDL